MIQIKRNNEVFYTIEDVCEGSKLSRQLMDHHYVILKFSTAEPVYFEIGDSVEIPGFGYFELTSAYFPKYNDSTDGYDYELQMDAYYMAWKNKICKYRPQYGANETSFKLTTTVGVHLNVILNNLKALGYKYNGLDFAVDYTTYNKGAFDVDKRFYIEYGSISILDALNAICDENALDCEWWVDGNIIYLGYCEMTGQVTFEQGVDMLSMSYSESKSSYITRLYAFGSDKNIPTGYFTGSDADVTTDGIATDYLMLPNNEVDSDGFYTKDGYLENTNVVKNEKQAIEGVVMFDDEYPKVECTVSGIKTYDSTVEENGEKKTQTFWQVTSKDSFATNFTKSWIKRNLTLMIKFTSGALMGMEFDVEYKIIEQVNYFEIVANETYGRSLPDGVMCPKEGDTFFLYNWDATKITETNLIQEAQDALYERAKVYYLKSMIDNSNFTCVLDAVKFYNHGVYNYHPLGEQVKLINPMFSDVDANGKHYRNSRIIGMDIKLDIPYDEPTYIVGEKAASSRLSKLEDKVTSITVNGIQIGGTGSGGGGVYVIGLNDSTPATDSNVYSARRVDQNYANKYREEYIREIYTFAKGLISDMLAKLNRGATFGTGGYKFDEKGNVVVDALSSLAFDEALERGFGVTKNSRGKYTLSVTDLMVWGKAVFNSLEIRKLYSVGGNVYLSGASSKLQHVVPVTDADGEVTGWKCYILGDDGTTATQNGWRKYDQAKCQTFDIEAGAYEGVKNTYYWRLVTDVSTENETITETRTEAYVDDDGVTKTREVTVDLYDGKKFGWVILSKTDCESATNDAPKAGDTIVLDGHRMFASGDPEGRDQYNDESRTNVMMLETTGAQGVSLPRIVALTGITDYRHSDGKNEYSNTVFILSPKEVVFVSSSVKWISASGDPITLVNFRGSWEQETEYGYYDQVSHGNAIWTCIVKKGDTTTDEPNDTSTDWRKEISGGKGEKGDKGAPGTPGNGIDRVETRFFAWKSDKFGTGFDSDRVWEDGSTTMPADFSDDFPWLWQVTRTYYTNGTDVLGEAVCIGYKGKDAVTYGVQVTPTYEVWSDAKKHAGIVLTFTKTTGSTMLKYPNVQALGTAKLYVDGTELEGLNKWVNGGSNKIIFDSFTFDGTNNTPTIGTASVIIIELIVDGKIVATANYANGKQGADGKGALEIICDPETIVLDTDDNGLVKDYSNAWAGLMCVRDGKVVDNVTYNIGEHDTVNCDATVNNNGIVTITSVDSQTVTIDGSTVTVSSTSGSVTVNVTEDATGVTYTKTVPFAVNVARYTGGLKADNKKLQSQYTELSNNSATKNDLKQYYSKIEQTARNISLKVMEKSVGRRNLLPGSAFRKQGEGCSIVQDGQDAINGICINGGYDGVNCARLRNEGDAGAACPRISWDGSRNSNVKVAKGKKYTLSFWAKRLSSTEGGYEISTQFFLQDGANGYARPYDALKMGSFTVKSQGEWEFIQDTVTIPSEAKSNYMEVCICLALFQRGMAEILVCRPMLEEGDEYNGWTLSEQDYDYVGGNLLDGTATLAKTGNVETLNPDNVMQGGMGESASISAVLSPTDTYVNFLQFSTDGMGLKANEDYVLSFYAKADSNPGRLQCYLYPSEGYTITEEIEGGYDYFNPSDGDLQSGGIVPGTTWKRYWVHWRPTKADPKHVLFRLLRGGNDRGTYSSYTTYAVDDVVLYDGTYYRCIMAGQGNTPSSSSSYWEATRYQISLSKPKLEVGATMTEWTAKRADMVDKQALYATGIDIDSKKITLTADHTYVRTNDGTPTVMIDADGNLTNVKVYADMVNVSATHQLKISGNGAMVVAMDNFKLDERGNASFKGSIESTSGRISFLTFTDSGMYSATSSSEWGLGLMSTNISVRGTPGGRHSLVCLGNGEVDATGGDANTYPKSLVDGQYVNYCNLIQVKDGGTGNGRDAAALGIETDGDFCLSAMGGLSHLQGLALDASTTTNGSSPNRTLFLCSGGHFTMPSNPKDGQLVIVIQTRDRIDFNGNGHRFQSGTYNSTSFTSDSAGQWSLFYYNNGVWYTIYMTR